MRLLLADDDAHIRKLIRALVERHGASLECAPDGDSALESIRTTEFDVIVLDLMMPGRNGFEVVQELKALHRELLDRVIVITAASTETIRWFDDSLIWGVIRKPFDVHELWSAIGECYATTRAE